MAREVIRDLEKPSAVKSWTWEFCFLLRFCLLVSCKNWGRLYNISVQLFPSPVEQLSGPGIMGGFGIGKIC